MAEQDTPENEHRKLTGDLLYLDMQRKVEFMKQTFGDLKYDTDREIDEGAFVHYFLPLFAGDYGGDAKKIKETLVQWYKVAGSPYVGVNVVNNGVVVAYVPPILENFLTGKPSGNAESVGGLFENAKQQATLHPRLGTNIVAKGLHQRFLTNLPRPDLSEAQKKWFDLLNHYGKAPKDMLSSTSAGSAKNAVEDDDFEY